MKYTNSQFKQILEVKQSKFIAHFIPYRDYAEVLDKLRQEHVKARHFVVAYRYLNNYNQIVEYSSDDGEPRGTSGRPSLMVLQGSNIINSAVIIVRYFGGTKLGTGGLVRAYSDVVNLVIGKSELTDYEEEITIDISFEYTNIRKIEYECLICNIVILDKIFSNQTIYKLRASKENMEGFLKKIDRISSILHL